MSADIERVVRTERCGPVLVITLNRPHARNAVDAAMAAELEAAVDLLESDDHLWVGVLAAEAPVFCAGADLKQVSRTGITGLVTARGGFAGFVRRKRTKPVIAALDGDALAGGMEIAIATDLIVARRSVRMGLPEARRSLLAVGGALAELPGIVGPKVALELAMSGEPVAACRMYELGLVNRIVDEGTACDAALELARTLCANSPLAVRASRRVIVDGSDMPSAERWSLADRELEILSTTEDYVEGPRAFVEKRSPQWTAR